VDPHSPYEPPSNFACVTNITMCDRIKESTLTELDFKRETLTGCKESEIPTKDNELYQTLYDGEIFQSDSMINRIFQTVKDLKIDKNTVIVFLSDHGESFDHNYYFAHGDVLYKSSTNIPLIIKYPLVNGAGRKNPRLIQNTDLLPTLLDLLNIPNKNLDIDGISFADDILPTSLPLSNPSKRQYTYSVNAGLSKFAIYDGKYTFIYSYDSEINKCLYKNQTEELYDLNTDPSQSTNIVTQNNAVAQDLKSRLLTKLSKHNLPLKPKSLNNDNTQKYINDSNDLEERLKSLGY
jgi:arylsulfatase A-like enzyme